MVKVIQVVSAVGHESSGPSYSVPAMCRGLAHSGCQIELCYGWRRPNCEFEFPSYNFPFSRFPHHSVGRSPGMFNYLRQACQSADIVHSNGLWMFSNVYPEWARKGTICKHVLQPRGTLSKWALANSRWRKRLFGWCFQYDVLKKADMFVATAATEYEEIRSLGYKQPVCILPNGIDLPDVKIDFRKGKQFRRMFFLSRIHPKKNLEMLISVWARLEDKFNDWCLSIIGPDGGNQYADEMKNLSRRLGCQRVRFEGELRGYDKYQFVAQSDCMVLPTHSENFGMVVAESLACGTPVICSHGAPWSGLNDCAYGKCGWWVPTTEEAFSQAMIHAMSSTEDELRRMGQNGRKWMLNDFSWDGIGNKMKTAYEWLKGSSMESTPNWVVVR